VHPEAFLRRWLIFPNGNKAKLDFLDGLHLSGQGYDESIPLTIAELKREDPRYIVPCHCTGWKVAYEIVNTMPEKFIQPSVGSIFCF
jgi:7,8-dihydropterin-6-yl-methyl-4-(beta-D-ribofuranosyl)aminobenzene 5'-phosphate synthase